jgi:hypothetical protein
VAFQFTRPPQKTEAIRRNSILNSEEEVREFLRRFLGDILFVFSPFSRRISLRKRRENESNSKEFDPEVEVREFLRRFLCFLAVFSANFAEKMARKRKQFKGIRP